MGVRFAVAEAMVVFDMGAKTWEPHPGLEWALAHRLRNLTEVSALVACERVWAYSNHEGRLCGYDGPSLSMGDMVRLVDEAGRVSLHRAAVLGFDDITDQLEQVAAARVLQPANARYRIPECDLATGRITRGDSWFAWWS